MTSVLNIYVSNLTVIKLCLPSLLVEQHLKRADKFEIRGGRDVIMSLKFEVISLRQVRGRRVKLLTHLNAALTHLPRHLHLVQEPRSDRLQRVPRPRLQITRLQR